MIKSILVVDDNEADQMITRTAINDYNPNIKILVAYDGTEALQVLRELNEPPSIILLDINMPQMNGFEFLEKYKTVCNSAIIVMLSSSDQEQDKMRALSHSDVKDYITKPITMEDLRNAVTLLGKE